MNARKMHRTLQRCNILVRFHGYVSVCTLCVYVCIDACVYVLSMYVCIYVCLYVCVALCDCALFRCLYVITMTTLMVGLCVYSMCCLDDLLSETYLTQRLA
jgi:hypothetical protein